jgi:hypothetical protein
MITEWMLAIALSLTIDAVVAGIQMYAGHWSPPTTLEIIIALCILGAVAQIIQINTNKHGEVT